MAGVPLPEERVIDGVDLSPALLEGKKSPNELVFYYRGTQLFAVRSGAFKAHFITQGGFWSEQPEKHAVPKLYNLNIDPSERFDVAATHPEVIESMNEIVRLHVDKLQKGKDHLADRGKK